MDPASADRAVAFGGYSLGDSAVRKRVAKREGQHGRCSRAGLGRGRDRSIHDQLRRDLRASAGTGPAARRPVGPHTAGFTGHGFRIFEVWESREDYERFFSERLMPLIQDVAPADDRQPQQTIYELHGFMAAGQ
jgi:hypothetical protein